LKLVLPEHEVIMQMFAINFEEPQKQPLELAASLLAT
jgi:hypothetical protein